MAIPPGGIAARGNIVNDNERSLICSLAAEIRAGGFSEEITINVSDDQVLGVSEIVKVDRAYVSGWEALWTQAAVADIDSVIEQNFLQPHPKGGGRYWLDTRRILAECNEHQ